MSTISAFLDPTAPDVSPWAPSTTSMRCHAAMGLAWGVGAVGECSLLAACCRWALATTCAWISWSWSPKKWTFVVKCEKRHVFKREVGACCSVELLNLKLFGRHVLLLPLVLFFLQHWRQVSLRFLVALGAVVFRKESYVSEEFADLLEVGCLCLEVSFGGGSCLDVVWCSKLSLFLPASPKKVPSHVST